MVPELSKEDAKSIIDSIQTELKTLRDLLGRALNIICDAQQSGSGTDESTEFMMDAMRFLIEDHDRKALVAKKLDHLIPKPTRSDLSGTA